MRERYSRRKAIMKGAWSPGAQRRPGASPDRIQEIRDQAEGTVRRSTLVLLGGCLYASTVLLKPDVLLLDRNVTFQLPFNSGEMSYSAFLLAGPLLLTGLWLYQVIYRAYTKELRNTATPKLPFIFNLPSRTAKLVSILLFYAMVPITMLLFAWKSSPRPLAPYLATAAAVSVAIAVYQFQRDRRRNSRYGISILSFGLTLAVLNLASPRTLDLRGANLEGFDLRGQNLSEALLDKYTNLANADLEGANLSFTDLRLVRGLSTAKLSHSVLAGVRLNDSDLSGLAFVGANLSQAELIRAKLLDSNMQGVVLKNANLTLAALDGADLSAWTAWDRKTLRYSWDPAILPNAVPVPQQEQRRSDLSGANLSFATFRDANLSLASFVGAEMMHTIFIDANLTGADLTGALLRSAALVQADLEGAEMEGADLRGATMYCSNLRNAGLAQVDLRKANLAGADLSGADVKGANLFDAFLPGARLSGLQNWRLAENVKRANFIGVKDAPQGFLQWAKARGALVIEEIADEVDCVRAASAETPVIR